MFYKKLNEYDILFGIEIEITGISKEDACKLLAKILKGQVYNEGKRYWTKDINNRIWRVVSDSSVSRQYKLGTLDLNSDTIISVENARGIFDKILKSLEVSAIEIVSPPCSIYDLNLILRIVDEFKRQGALTNDSCGIHIHISSPLFSSGKLKNLIRLNSKLENFIFGTFNVADQRRNKYCKPAKPSFVSDIEKLNCKKASINTILEKWYALCSPSTIDDISTRNNKYHPSRYHALNLHSFFMNDTIEFRYFNSTLDTKSIEVYILFCIAMVLFALDSKSFNFKSIDKITEKNIHYIIEKLHLEDFHYMYTYLLDNAKIINI